MSYSDSAFLRGQREEKDFQKVMDDNDCIQDTVPIGDHNVLGIIGRWAHTLKTVLTKAFLENGYILYCAPLALNASRPELVEGDLLY